MAWGNPEPATAAPVAPVVVTCEAPDCNNPAKLIIKLPDSEDEHKSCAACCNSNVSIVGVIEGAEYDEETRDVLLKAWENSKAVLERAKNTEMSLRKSVGAFVFPTPKEGVNNHDLGGGYTLKLGHKLNYKLVGDNDKLEEVEEKAAKLGNEGEFLIERIIVWKAEFSKSEYNKLDEGLPTHKEVKKLVDSVLEISAGSPSLEIKEPKATLR
jgi:hypothetical protein